MKRACLFERAVSGPFRRLVPEGCDHYPHLVCPDLVTDTVCDFLAGQAQSVEAAR